MGTSGEAVMRADQWTYHIRGIQAGLEAKLNDLIPTLERRGYSGEQEVDVELRIFGKGYQAFFPRYGVVANLEVNPN